LLQGDDVTTFGNVTYESDVSIDVEMEEMLIGSVDFHDCLNFDFIADNEKTIVVEDEKYVE